MEHILLPAPPKLPNREVRMITEGKVDGTSNRARKTVIRAARGKAGQVMVITHTPNDPEISFGPKDERPLIHPHTNALVCTVELALCLVHRTFVDTESSVNILYQDCLEAVNINAQLKQTTDPLYGFPGEMVMPAGQIELPLTMGSPAAKQTRIVEFLVISQTKPAYNVILGRPTLDAFRAVVSMYYLKMKFPIEGGIGEVYGNQLAAKECYAQTVSQ
ncbi:uncharacterized protein LOC131005100 [Salvia miltiorrhiza]|uniref:uncharacterized protein LOC131005100 n=1 Tax=Salvia miltiorrhiza TaxID=226208 RepID=UPI0025ABAAA9|nr:uncharacterized protein LOC131005100 [Salvia miltiorrhiza]